MSQSSNPFSSIISVNPYRNIYFTSSGQHIAEEKKPLFSKTQYAISFLNTKSFITAMVGISKNIPDEDLYDALENKVYDELALDMAVEYKIQFIEATHATDESDKYYHVFIVDPLTLEEDFKGVVEQIKYLDQIVPIPLLFQALYKRELIHDTGLHIFIYFQENDASLTIYDDQNFLYTKSLKYSFRQMHERFVELIGEQIGYEQFLSSISENGIGLPNPEYQKYLIKLFGELFLHINDVLTYAKRAFEIELVDHVYIGSLIGSITGLDEYAQTYLGLPSSLFDFNYGFTVEGNAPDQIHALMHLFAQLDATERYDCNFTQYHRPPPFVKRQSGKIIMLTAASLLGAMLYPVTYWTLQYTEDMHFNILSNEYRELHNQKIEREALINIKLANQKKYESLYNDELQEYQKSKNTLLKIHDVKVNYPMKAKQLAYFTNDFNRYDVNIKDITYQEPSSAQRSFSFTLIAKNDKQLTDLLKYLTANRSKSYNFSMDKITFAEEEKLYTSELKAVLR